MVPSAATLNERTMSPAAPPVSVNMVSANVATQPISTYMPSFAGPPGSRGGSRGFSARAMVPSALVASSSASSGVPNPASTGPSSTVSPSISTATVVSPSPAPTGAVMDQSVPRVPSGTNMSASGAAVAERPVPRVSSGSNLAGARQRGSSTSERDHGTESPPPTNLLGAILPKPDLPPALDTSTSSSRMANTVSTARGLNASPTGQSTATSGTLSSTAPANFGTVVGISSPPMGAVAAHPTISRARTLRISQPAPGMTPPSGPTTPTTPVVSGFALPVVSSPMAGFVLPPVGVAATLATTRSTRPDTSRTVASCRTCQVCFRVVCFMLFKLMQELVFDGNCNLF